MSSRYRRSGATATPGPSRSTAGPTPTPARRPTAVVGDELPAYRKPSHPLNEQAQEKLRTLNGRSTVVLKEHSKKASDRVTAAVALIQDTLYDRRDAVEKDRKTWDRGINTENQEDDENRLMYLQQQADEYTTKLEESMRAVIDNTVAVQRIEESLEWLRQNAPARLERDYATQGSQQQSQRLASQSQWRRMQSEYEDGNTGMTGEDTSHELEGPTPGPTPPDGFRPSLTGASEMYAERIERQKNEYTSLSLAGRYARNEAYVNFKKMLHDAQYRDEDRPLPHEDTWFTESGSPAPGITGHSHNDDGDDDIVMERATISIKCPITFMEFRDPYTSVKCPHTFERNAILEMIRKSAVRLGGGATGRAPQAVRCPVPGCDQMLTANDLHHDPILARRIKRMQEKKAREGEESNAEEEEEEEEDITVTQPSTRRSEPQIKVDPSSRMQVPSTQRSVVEDLGDPSDEDEDEDEV